LKTFDMRINQSQISREFANFVRKNGGINHGYQPIIALRGLFGDCKIKLNFPKI